RRLLEQPTSSAPRWPTLAAVDLPDARHTTSTDATSRSSIAGELPEKLIEACGLSRVSGHVSCVGQKLPSSGRASTIATSRPAFCRYAAAGRPPETPPPTTITSNVIMRVASF